jgi:hypothetical protein
MWIKPLRKDDRPMTWNPSFDVAVVPLPQGGGRRLCHEHWQDRLDAGEPLPRSAAAAQAGELCEDCLDAYERRFRSHPLIAEQIRQREQREREEKEEKERKARRRKKS